MTGVIALVTIALSVLFAGMLPPALIALATGQGALVDDFLMTGLLGLGLTGLVIAALADRGRALNRSQSFLAVLLIWIAAPIAGALPFIFVFDMAPVTALFESTSGLTTTSASALTQDLPLPLLFWRMELEWIGGYLTLACVIHIMSPSGIGGLPRTSAQVTQAEGDSGLSPVHYGQFLRLMGYYGLATLVIAVFLIMTGVPGKDALMLSMTAISTSGFLPFDGPLDQHVGAMGQAIFAAGLFLGATSILWRRTQWTDPSVAIRQHTEAIWIAVAVIVIGLIYATRLFIVAGSASVLEPMSALGEGLFTAMSVVSTSGVETRPGVIAVAPELFVLVVVLAGGAIFSTAGGIKFYRIGGMILQAHKELALLVFPSGIVPQHLSGIHYGNQTMRAALIVFIAAVLTIALATLLLSASHGSFQSNLTAAVALFSNAGPIYLALKPLTADPAYWPGFDAFGTLGTAVSIVLMVLGRLEILIVFAALNISYWINR